MRYLIALPLLALSACADGTQEQIGELSGKPADVDVALLLNTVTEQSTVTLTQGKTVCVASFVAPYGQASVPLVAKCNDGRSGSGAFSHSRPLGTFVVNFALNDGTTGSASF